MTNADDKIKAELVNILKEVNEKYEREHPGFRAGYLQEAEALLPKFKELALELVKKLLLYSYYPDKETESWVGCAELKILSQGETKEIAKKATESAVNLYLEGYFKTEAG